MGDFTSLSQWWLIAPGTFALGFISVLSLFRESWVEFRSALDKAKRVDLEPEGVELVGLSFKTTIRRLQALVILGTTVCGVALLLYYLGTPWSPNVAPDRLMSIVAWALGGAGSGVGTGALFLYQRVLSTRRYLDAIRDIRHGVIGSLDENQIKKVEVARRRQLARTEILLKRNLDEPFEIKQLAFQRAGIFPDLAWHLSSGINVLLGRNGYGKSYLLRLLVGLLSYDNDRLGVLLHSTRTSPQLSLALLRRSQPAAIEHDGEAFVEAVGKVPLLAIPDSRFINRAKETVAAESGDHSDLARHGAHHFLYDIPYDSTLQTVLAQICIEVGTGDRAIKYPESPQIELITRVMHALSGETFRIREIRPVGGAKFSIMVETDASPGEPISIQKASQGTLSVVAIFGLIYQYLRKLYPGETERGHIRQKAIVIIDEVDAHLHPVWQRKIVYLLRHHFPNVQFILTAHSPLVVGGCSYGEVSVLKRSPDGLFVQEFQRHFVGSSVNDIYREVFEVEDRDEMFLDYYAQLPIVKDLEKELEDLKASREPDEARMKRAEQELSFIREADQREEKELHLEVLQRENEQLKRQLEALRRDRPEQGS